MTVNTLGSHHDTRTSRTVAEWLWPFVPMGIAAFSLSALIYYHLWQNVFTVSSPLQQLYAWVYVVFGFAPSVMFFGLTILWSTIWLACGRVERPVVRFVRLSAMAIMLGIFLNLGDGGVSPSPQKGQIGAWFAETLVYAMGYWPSLLLVWAITFASLLLATDFFFHESFERMRVAPAPAGDAGVEPAVTDHLRGLGAVVAPIGGRAATPSPAPTAAPAAPDTPAAADPLAGFVAEAAEAPAAEPRRRSYEERRAARSWRRAEEEEWLPPAAPESQEIDDPEGRAVVAPAADVAAAPAEDAVPEAVEPAAPAPAPAFDEAAASPASRQADDADAADDTAAEELSTPIAEALVWPDELPAVESNGVAPAELAAFAADQVAEPAADAASASAADERSDERSEEHADDHADEPVVAIPRPEPAPVVEVEAVDLPVRQQGLFGARVDEALLQEAVELVTDARRANVTFLQRKLRVDYETAVELMAALAARGVVALDGDATQGRVLG